MTQQGRLKANDVRNNLRQLCFSFLSAKSLHHSNKQISIELLLAARVYGEFLIYEQIVHSKTLMFRGLTHRNLQQPFAGWSLAIARSRLSRAKIWRMIFRSVDDRNTGCPFINLSIISSRTEGTPAMRSVSSTTGMIVTGSALLISGSRCLLECIPSADIKPRSL
jgi:hypothetical protein